MNGIGKTLTDYYKGKRDIGIGTNITDYYKYQPTSGGGGGESHVDEDGLILDDWATIASLINSGKATYEIGNYKPLDLGSEGIVNMEIVALNADELADGSGYAPTTWISKELLPERSMNDARSPASQPYTEGTGMVGGWEKTRLRAYLRDTVAVYYIPATVKNSIKEVKKTSLGARTKGLTLQEKVTGETLWIPSVREIFGDTEYGQSVGEKSGVIYSVAFKEDADRIKKQGETATAWWLRTAADSQGARGANNKGQLPQGMTYAVTTKNGIALGFCI